MNWIDEIRDAGAGRVEEAARLDRLTTLRVGGPAEALLHLEDPGRLPAALAVLARRGVPWRFLGNGSNVMVRDGGVDGAVILMTALRDFASEGETVTVGAGLSLIGLVQAGHRQGLLGMEWASGIPGSVGGAIVMNAGAHGHDTAEFLEAALIVETGEPEAHWVEGAQLAYSYRHSRLQSEESGVLAGRFRLRQGDAAEGRRLLRAFLLDRKAKQPSGNNAGSMFKNPPGDYAGRLIEAAGGKGHHEGGAEISTLHGNFFLNTGTATARDVLRLVDWAREAVRKSSGRELELEVEVWGEG